MKKIIYNSKFFQRLVQAKRRAGVFRDESVMMQEAYMQIIKIICCIGFVSVLVCILIGGYQPPESLIQNGSIKKGDVEKKYELYYETAHGKVTGNTDIVVPQKKYEKEEAEKLFRQVEERLETEILGSNQSLEKVSTDLNFVDCIEGIPVDISWSTDEEEYINSYGEVFSAYAKTEGKIVMITALLTLGEYEKVYSFPVCVVMPDKKDSKWWQRAVEQKLKALQEQSESQNEYLLPKQIVGSSIIFEEKNRRRPWEYFLAIPVAAVVLMWGTLKEEEKQKGKKEEALLREYPEIVSRLSLYIQSGMTSKKAIGKIVDDYEKIKLKAGKKTVIKWGYEELLVTHREMQHGISEHMAYKNLGERIGLNEYKKLSAILVQQLEKGSRSFLDNLQQETKEAFDRRKRNAKEVGEKAGTELLLPMGILLIITLAVIMVPAFLSFTI